MDALDKHVIKTALVTLRAVGGIGMLKSALLNQIDLAAGTPTTDEQREAAFAMMRDRGWMTYYLDAVWHNQRWYITDRGVTAMEAM